MSIGSGLLAAVLAATSVTTAGAVPAESHVTPARGDTAGSARTTSSRWAWPLDPRPEVMRRFDRPDQPWLPGHRGVDLAAAVGQSVLAPTDGRVTWTGVIAGRSVVVVSHQGGLRSTFEPVVATVPVGTAVARGQDVGAMAATPGHCAPRTCLHWGVLRGETYLDPLALVGRAEVVLLPVP
jgi:murein DD-endopeptidase MepM/ murein hydrolase activator NlpD